MKVFRRKITEIILWGVYAAVAALMGFSLAWSIGWPVAVQVLLPLALAAPFLYYLLYRDNIRIEITKRGKFSFYRLNRLVRSFELSECQVTHKGGATASQKRGPRDLTLRVTGPALGDKPVKLDCGPLGRAQFMELCRSLAPYSD